MEKEVAHEKEFRKEAVGKEKELRLEVTRRLEAVVQKEQELRKETVRSERELREEALKAPKAELDKRVLDLLFRDDYGDLRDKLDKLKKPVSFTMQGTL